MADTASDVAEHEFPPGAFDRIDDGDDAEFYAPPRLVTHLDESAIAALTKHYSRALKPGGTVLDLMSSWISHLPEELPFGRVIGHGMNAKELAANPRLTESFAQDLNKNPELPLTDTSVDAALCCVSVQYLQRPVEVFAEVRRVLRPGAPFIVSYSNRCFPTKAVAMWRALDLRQHAALVHLYFTKAAFHEITVDVLANGMEGDPLVAVTGYASATKPGNEDCR